MKGTLLILALVTACAVYSQKNRDIVKIEFTSLSRGGIYKQIVCTKDSLIISTREGRGSDLKTINKKITSADWTKLLHSLDNVSLSEIPDLKSPTMKRAHDGALHSDIKVFTNSMTLSHSFDDENPHEKLKGLLKLLLKKAS